MTWRGPAKPPGPRRTPATECGSCSKGKSFARATYRRNLDFALVGTILARGDFRFSGMIGSKAKRAQLEQRLAARGFSAEAIAQMSCPIGVASINGHEPGTVAVATELVQAHERTAARAQRRLRAEARSDVA
jgi:xanthine/CO dehydrogenase XdhC/CoxF family maturation factor